MSIAGLADLVLRDADPRRGDGRRPRRRGPDARPDRRRRRCGRSWSRAWSTPAAPCWRSPRPRARPRTWSSELGGAARPGLGRATTRPGRRCRTSGSAPRSDTVGRRLAVLRRLAPPRHRRGQRPARGGRRAGPLGAAAAGQGAGRPRAGRAGGRRRGRRSTTSYAGSPTRRTPGSTWSRSAASSRSAAASSTSSRRPRSTRCGWSSGATRSRRSASFAVADQRTLEPVDRLWAPPCRELLLTDDVRRRAAEALGEAHPAAGRDHRQDRRRASPSRAWSRWPRCSSTRWSCSSTCCPTDTHVLVLDPERVRSRAHDLVATSEEFLGASLGGGGRRRHRRRSTSAPRRTATLGDVRAARARRRARPGGRVSPFGLDRRRRDRADVATSRRGVPSRAVDRGRPRPTAATSSGPSPTSAAGSPTATAWSSLHARATARRSGWSRCSASTTSPARLVETLDDDAARAGRRHGHHAAPSTTASSTTAVGLVAAHRRRPVRPARRPPATCAGCRPGARSRSTRSSSRPATTSSTSSTASAASSR